jgi:hypothetical protein
MSSGKQTPQAKGLKSGSQKPDGETGKEMVELSRRQLFWTIIGAIVGGVAIAVTVVVFLFDHIREDRKNETTLAISQGLEPIWTYVRETRGRIERIDGELDVLRPLMESTIEGQLKKSSALTPKEFEEGLPNLYQALNQARAVGVKPEPKLLSALATKLANARTSAIGYWPATAEFISYRSQFSTVQKKAAKSTSGNAFPVCTETELHPAKVISVPSPTKITFELPYFENCKLKLDDAEQQAQINRLLKTKAATGIAFKDSLVEYTGGEINIDLFQDAHDQSRKISSLLFINCTFDLRAYGSPSHNAEAILLDLLLNANGDLAVVPGHELRMVPVNPSPQ